MRALVVIPTYDESANIVGILERLRDASPASVLVVDDASPDGTAELVEGAAGRLGDVTVMRRPRKAGLGSAYRDGFRWGLDRGFEAMVEMDADGSHDPAALPELLAAVAGGADLAIGSRYVEGGSIVAWTAGRRALSRSGNWYASRVLGLAVRDATSGFRAYRAAALRAMDVDSLRSDGYGFQIETAYRVQRAGGAILEIPIRFVDRTRGRTKMSRRIVVEALALVTWWGVRDRVRARTPRGTTASSR